MGQRLVITIKDGRKKLASGYYHWSAYTESAYNLVEPIIQALKVTQITKDDDKKLIAIRLLESTGAGISEEDDKELFCKLYPNETAKPAISRNEGLIAISKKEIEDSIKCGEEFIEINLAKGMIKFGVWSFYYTKEEFDDCHEGEDISINDLGLPPVGKRFRTLLNWLTYDEFLELYGQADLNGVCYNAIDGDDPEVDNVIISGIC